MLTLLLLDEQHSHSAKGDVRLGSLGQLLGQFAEISDKRTVYDRNKCLGMTTLYHEDLPLTLAHTKLPTFNTKKQREIRYRIITLCFTCTSSVMAWLAWLCLEIY